MSTPEPRPGLFLQPFVVSQLVGEVVADLVRGSGVSGTEFAVMSAIAVWPGSTPTQLSRRLGMPPTTLSALLNRLEDRGQVRRMRDRGDGRRFILELTARGRRTRQRNLERFPTWLQRVQDHLGADPESVLDAMRKLEDALRRALADQKP